MDDLDLDFAVTYNGQYIFSKDRVLFTSPISKLHLRHLISYAKKRGHGDCSRDQGCHVEF